MIEEAIRTLVTDIGQGLRNHLPGEVGPDQVDELTRLVVETILRGGGPLGRPELGFTRLVVAGFNLGVQVSGGVIRTPAPPDPGDQVPVKALVNLRSDGRRWTFLGHYRDDDCVAVKEADGIAQAFALAVPGSDPPELVGCVFDLSDDPAEWLNVKLVDARPVF